MQGEVEMLLAILIFGTALLALTLLILNRLRPLKLWTCIIPFIGLNPELPPNFYYCK